MTQPLTLVRSAPFKVPAYSPARPPAVVEVPAPSPGATAFATDAPAPSPTVAGQVLEPAGGRPVTVPTAPGPLRDNDAGMSTVEYAVGTVVAAAFAAVLYRIVTGDSIVAGLTALVQSALNTGF